MAEFSGKSILVVDDDEDLREVLVFEVERLGFSVGSAVSGRDALSQLEKKLPDVVLTDIRMPNGDGIELLESIKKRDLKSPIVILMTGYSDTDSKEALKKGASALLVKPFPSSVLVEILRTHLQKQ